MMYYGNLIADVRGYIEKDISDITVKKLAQEFCLQESYFSRMFKRIAGITCRQFLIETKINKGKQLLQDSSKSIKEIAYELGYKNPNHFTYMFKKRQGVSPTQYREIKKRSKKRRKKQD